MNFEIDNDFALLYGIMLGDGCLSLSRGRRTMKFIVVTGDSVTDLSFFRNFLHPLLKKYRGKDTNIRFRKDCNGIEFNFVDNRLFDFIHSIGFPIGKKGTEIEIPKIFYEKNLVNHVIAGFVATDGSLVLTKNPNKYYPRIEAHAICKNLLQQIHNHLNSLGLNGRFYQCKRINFWKGNTKKIIGKEKQFRIQFNGKKNLLLFENLIGFVNFKHKRRFDEFIKYDKEYDSTSFSKSLRVDDLSYNAMNNSFKSKMALGGVEPPIFASPIIFQ